MVQKTLPFMYINYICSGLYADAIGPIIIAVGIEHGLGLRSTYLGLCQGFKMGPG